MGKTGTHPTAERLIATAIELLNAGSLESVTVEDVLEHSGISRGSLYHHFEDFPTLLDHALIAQFTKLTDASIALLADAFGRANSAAEYRETVRAVMASVHVPDNSRVRAMRAITIARATDRPKLRSMLSTHQARQTAMLIEVIRMGQERGWVRTELDQTAAAVLLQAVNFGSILDDVSEHHMDRAEYLRIIDHIVNHTFLRVEDQ